MDLYLTSLALGGVGLGAMAMSGFLHHGPGHGQIAQARADAAKVRLNAEAAADAEAIRIRRVADATAESIQKVNQAIEAGGESYFRYRQIEMLPQIAPAIADALAQSKMVTVSGGGGSAPETATNNMVSVIQTVLAAQLVSRGGLLDGGDSGTKAK